MLVHRRPRCQRRRRSRLIERSCPCGPRNEDLRVWRLVTQRAMRPQCVVEAPPALDNDLGLGQRVEDLTIQQLVTEPTSVTPIWRTASATGILCELRTSICRSLTMISSGVCFFLGMIQSSLMAKDLLQVGPLQGGRITCRIRPMTVQCYWGPHLFLATNSLVRYRWYPAPATKIPKLDQ